MNYKIKDKEKDAIKEAMAKHGTVSWALLMRKFKWNFRKAKWVESKLQEVIDENEG